MCLLAVVLIVTGVTGFVISLMRIIEGVRYNKSNKK